MCPPAPGGTDAVQKVKKERMNGQVRGNLNTDFWAQTKEECVTYDGFQIWGFGGKKETWPNPDRGGEHLRGAGWPGDTLILGESRRKFRTTD